MKVRTAHESWNQDKYLISSPVPCLFLHQLASLATTSTTSRPIDDLHDQTYNIATGPAACHLVMAPYLAPCLVLLSLIAPYTAASVVWTLNCAPLTQQRSDPILSPGVASGHVHAVVGSTAFSRNMSGIDGAKDGNATTCDKYTDHSSYWAPQLYHMRLDGLFDILPFTGMVAYYENYTCPYDPKAPGPCTTSPRNATAFPPGLEMIAGNSLRRTLNLTDPWQQAILLESGNNGEVYGIPTVLDGQRLSGHVRFPSCWDGVNLTSGLPQTHVAYPDASLGGTTQGGMCPQSHPVALINIGAEFGWSLNGIVDPLSLVFANGDTTGFGFHGDFYMGWEDPTALQNSFANCGVNGGCSWDSFGSPNGQAPSPMAMNPETPAPVENIGLNGPISALPGNNPVYKPLRFQRK